MVSRFQVSKAQTSFKARGRREAVECWVCEEHRGVRVPVVMCEPPMGAAEFSGSEVTHDLEGFKAGCDIVIANRWSDELGDVADKVYTRDLFKRN